MDLSGIQLEEFRPLDIIGGITNLQRTSPKRNDSDNNLNETLLGSASSSSSSMEDGRGNNHHHHHFKIDKHMLTSIFNLSNNVAGAGMLTLSAAMASGTGWLAAIIICSLLAFASAHTFTLIAMACDLSGQNSFRGLWTVAFGNSAYILDLAIFFQCFLSSIIYCGLLGDIFSDLLPLIGYSIHRSIIIVLFGIVVLLPLCLIRNLAALSFTSILGLVAVLYTMLFITYRSIDGSYSIHPTNTGKFIDDQIIDVPSFQHSSPLDFNISSLVLCANLGLAFVAHYNAPTYWREFPNNATVKSFATMVRISYSILAAVYSITMCAGVATFGVKCRGNILLNYHQTDQLATLGRLATGLSVTFGFPLVFCGARDGLKGAMDNAWLSDPRNHNKLVISLLSLICILSMLVKDVKFIASFSGAIMGSFLVYICPTLIYSKIVLQMRGSKSHQFRISLLNLSFIPFGIFVSIVGLRMTLKDALK